MANLFQDNAYNILGLDTSTTQKVINKRAKEIIQLLKIDEIPVYETDLSLAKPSRDESSVKDSLQNLSSPKNRVKDYFFWFDIETDQDERVLTLIQNDDTEKAIDLWKLASEKESTEGYLAKKNLAILTSLLLAKSGQKKYLTLSLGCWKDTILSEKFWSHFEKIYALNDDIGTDKATIEKFRKNVTDDLSNFYTDVSQLHDDLSIYSLFSKLFSAKGDRIQQNVLDPIYDAINSASERLEKLNISEDNIISQDEIDAVRELTKILKDNFEKLKSLGLYDDSQSKKMRDKAAEALNTVALDLYNNLNEYQKPAALLSFAEQIAGTQSLKNKLSKDLATVRKNISDEKIIKPINELLTAEEYDEALELIEKRLIINKNQSDLREYLILRLQWCVTAIAGRIYKESMALFEKGDYDTAKQGFINCNEFILSYLDHFNFDQDSLNNVLQSIDNLTNNSNNLNFDNIQNYRNQIIDGASETFKDQFEQTILLFLVDCGIYTNLASHIPKIKKNNAIKKWIWYAVIGAGILIWIAVGSSSSDNSSTGSDTSSPTSSSSSSTAPDVSAKQAAYDACVTQYNSLKAQLNSIESQMNSYNAAQNVTAYNNLVPQQNDLVRQTNAKADECNGLR